MFGIVCFVAFVFCIMLSCVSAAIDRKRNIRALFLLSIDSASCAILLFPVSIVLLCLGF